MTFLFPSTAVEWGNLEHASRCCDQTRFFGRSTKCQKGTCSNRVVLDPGTPHQARETPIMGKSVTFVFLYLNIYLENPSNITKCFFEYLQPVIKGFTAWEPPGLLQKFLMKAWMWWKIFAYWMIMQKVSSRKQKNDAFKWPYKIKVPIAVIWGVCWMFTIYKPAQDNQTILENGRLYTHDIVYDDFMESVNFDTDTEMPEIILSTATTSSIQSTISLGGETSNIAFFSSVSSVSFYSDEQPQYFTEENVELDDSEELPSTSDQQQSNYSHPTTSSNSSSQFVCVYPRCVNLQQFTNNRDFILHLSRVHTIQYYNCGSCSANFNRKDNYKKHLKKKTHEPGRDTIVDWSRDPAEHRGRSASTSTPTGQPEEAAVKTREISQAQDLEAKNMDPVQEQFEKSKLKNKKLKKKMERTKGARKVDRKERKKMEKKIKKMERKSEKWKRKYEELEVMLGNRAEE